MAASPCLAWHILPHALLLAVLQVLCTFYSSSNALCPTLPLATGPSHMLLLFLKPSSHINLSPGNSLILHITPDSHLPKAAPISPDKVSFPHICVGLVLADAYACAVWLLGEGSSSQGLEGELSGRVENAAGPSLRTAAKQMWGVTSQRAKTGAGPGHTPSWTCPLTVHPSSLRAYCVPGRTLRRECSGHPGASYCVIPSMTWIEPVCGTGG